MLKMNSDSTNLLTIEEASRLLNVNPETLRRWDRSGELTAIRIGKRKDRRYKKEDILRMLNNKTKNKLRVVSLFSGCGGLDLGFRGDFTYLGKYYEPHNYELLWANDYEPKSCQTYRNYFKTDHVVCGDFTELVKNPDSIPDCDVILGGFPCQDFSVAGKRLGFSAKRGKLYLSMRDLIIAKRPMAFVAENVKGLLNIGQGEVIKIIEKDFSDAGYKVTLKLYHTADYGVPQTRERVIIIGIRKDIDAHFTPPEPTHTRTPNLFTLKPWVTAKEALDDLADLPEGSFPTHFWSKAKLFKGTQGNSVISPDKPAPTMRAEHHGNIEFHYNNHRRLSAREAARIQSFPDDFEFFKSTSDAYRQIGNAVAPVFGWHIAKALQESLKNVRQEEKVQVAPVFEPNYIVEAV